MEGDPICRIMIRRKKECTVLYMLLHRLSAHEQDMYPQFATGTIPCAYKRSFCSQMIGKMVFSWLAATTHSKSLYLPASLNSSFFVCEITRKIPTSVHSLKRPPFVQFWLFDDSYLCQSPSHPGNELPSLCARGLTALSFEALFYVGCFFSSCWLPFCCLLVPFSFVWPGKKQLPILPSNLMPRPVK